MKKTNKDPRTRGKTITGTVTSDKMSKTVTVTWNRRIYIPKYERYEKKISKVKAHNPEKMNAKKGDVVKIAETRPLSKTKHFMVIEVLGKETKKEAVKKESIEESSKETKKENESTKSKDK